MKIEDDFLDQEEFDKLQSLIMYEGFFSWYYNFYINNAKETKEEKFQFTHMFYYDAAPQSSCFKDLWPILDKLQPITIFRIKANLLTKTPNIVENNFHVDIGDISEEKLKHFTTSIFFVNTNNGYTKFEDGTKVESVANRMITFPANLRHTGTSCTDENIRIIINFNYFK